jgi:carboxylesterase type B
MRSTATIIAAVAALLPAPVLATGAGAVWELGRADPPRRRPQQQSRASFHQSPLGGPVATLPGLGQVRGSCWSTACAYRAVPYAAPPIGPGRWRPPMPARPWAGVLDGTAPGPACIQTPLDQSTPQSEDCLHSDVYTPLADVAAPVASQRVGRPLPVIVFFYGGGMLSGANAWYNLSAFVNSGGSSGFVVVVPNYRLGPLGWLALAELSAEAGGSSGNYGMMDAQRSLQWVQEHIHAFGGDPARVTVMGQSSGATLLYGLLAHLQPPPPRRSSERRQKPPKPLFNAAILLSGSPNISMALADAEAQNAALVSAVGCASGGGRGKPRGEPREGGAVSTAGPAAAVLACLRRLSAGAVSHGVAPINTSWQLSGPLTWGWPTPEHAATVSGRDERLR